MGRGLQIQPGGRVKLLSKLYVRLALAMLCLFILLGGAMKAHVTG